MVVMVIVVMVIVVMVSSYSGGWGHCDYYI